MLEIIFLTVMVVSLVKICLWLKDNMANKNVLDEVSKNVFVDESKDTDDEDKYTVDFEALKKINSDTVAYLKVEGTKIEYPVVKTENNDYYLHYNFEKKENTAGWIFMDYRNNLDGADKNIIIYGHSRKDGSMFGTLWHTLKDEWYENKSNRYITLVTPEGSFIYEVFSVYTTKAEDYYITTSFTDSQFSQFISTLKSRSVRNFDVEVGQEDQILTLSTCFGNDENRAVLHAKKIVKNEE